jgi:hypothetical protein
MAIIGTSCSVGSAGLTIYSKARPTEIAPTPDPVIEFVLINSNINDGLGSVFTAHQSGKSQMLAVALAAISNQSNVDVFIDDISSLPAGQTPMCYAINMRPLT